MLQRMLSLIGGGLLLSACVTINIYFPAAEAEEAAKQIVEDILSEEGAAPQAAPMPDKGASRVPHSLRSVVAAIGEWLIPAAHAASPDFNVDTPEVRRLQARIKSRHGQLQGFYDVGAIGFTRNGDVMIRDAGAVSLRDRSRLQQLVSQENADRSALYRAIAKANGRPEWEADVRQVFARQWIDQARGGWWYQDSGGAWRQR